MKAFVFTTRVARAEPIRTDEDPAEMHLIIGDDLPIHPRPQSETQRRFEIDAHHIADALRRHLPGGTFDRLVAELLRMKSCDLIVPLPMCQS